jgi:predicted nucleic acid-binding protein
MYLVDTNIFLEILLKQAKSQNTVCKHYGFKLTTMDQDFKNIKDVDLLFL